ncbi:MAG TPA: hypothetical protein VM285_04005, partial [Polyangia bacterium]|nr:hypothetical protein [Polyangia bacterium]
LRVSPAPRAMAELERATARRLDAAGYDPGRVLFVSETAVAGDRHRAAFDAVAGECGMLLAVAGPGVVGLALEIRADGALLSRADGEGREPVLLPFCAAEAGPLAVEVALVSGAGSVRVAFHPLPGAPLPPGLVDPPLALREAAAIFARHGLVPEGGLLAPEPVPGIGWAAPFEARPGFCYGFAAVRRDDIAIESFRLTDPAGRELGRWTGPASPALLARCVFGSAEELLLEVADPTGGPDAKREPPLIAVFASDAAAAASPWNPE